jgi:predicted acylesterase/phospholipase RssA/CRP-like cAMP-binding protein
MRNAASFEGVAVPVSALEGVPLFDGLGPAELVAVAASMRFHDFPAQAVICHEGAPGASMFVVLDGLAHQLAAAPDAGELRTRSVFAEGRLVGKLRQGDVFGATSLVTGEPRSATVRAAVPTSALELGEEDFRALIARFPAILSNLTRILSDRLAAATRRQAERGRRGEAVALIAGPSLASAIPAVVAAAQAASVRPVESLEAGSALADALARLDDALHEQSTVVLVAGLHDAQLPLLLEHVDRAVVLLGEEDGEPTAALAAADRLVELVRVERAPTARPLGGTGTPRLVRVAARGDGHDRGGLPPDEIAWLGRHLSRTKLGLALGAGGAKGYAHVGALGVLEDAGYTVDCVGGSSIGAIVGAYRALGMGAAEIDTTLREAFTPDAVAEVFKLSLSGESTGRDTMSRIFRETTGERSFDETVIPLVLMAVDLTDRVPKPLRDGPIWQALLASTALAGMFPPYERDGHRLVDGLALVPVPTHAVEAEGADLTVSVNLLSRDTLAAWPGEAPPPPEQAKRGSRMLETLLEVMDLSQLDTSVRHADLADVTITPRFGPSSWRDFHLADLFMMAGRRAAEEQLPALQALARPQSVAVTTT